MTHSLNISGIVGQLFVESLNEEPIHLHPEVRDLRNKGYSVYVSKVHRDSPYVVHEVEKSGNSIVVLRHEGDGKYRIRTGGFGALSKTTYDTLHQAVVNGLRVKNTGKYPNVDRAR